MVAVGVTSSCSVSAVAVYGDASPPKDVGVPSFTDAASRTDSSFVVSCYREDEAIGFPRHFKAPESSQGLCSPTQIDAFQKDCLGLPAGSATCTALIADATNMPCFSCIKGSTNSPAPVLLPANSVPDGRGDNFPDAGGIVLPEVKRCVDQPADPQLFRLPRSKAEGARPQMAIASGESDPFECLLTKMGIDPKEFTSPVATPSGRVHYFRPRARGQQRRGGGGGAQRGARGKLGASCGR